MPAKPQDAGEGKDEPEARRTSDLVTARRQACDAIGAIDMREAQRLMYLNVSNQRRFANKMAEHGF